MTRTEKLYPISYRGKDLYPQDCHPVFVNTYRSRRSLRYNKSVYLAGGLSITPTGEYVDR